MIQGDDCHPRRSSWLRSPWLTPILNSSELRGLYSRSYFGPRTCGRSITNVIEVGGALNQGCPFSLWIFGEGILAFWTLWVTAVLHDDDDKRIIIMQNRSHPQGPKSEFKEVTVAHVVCHCSGFPGSFLSGTLLSYWASTVDHTLGRGHVTEVEPMSSKCAGLLIRVSPSHPY